MNLFAYGTLMTPEGSQAALGDRASTLRYKVARLRGWRRVWNAYRPEWNGGVLNVEPDPGSEVVGVLIEGMAPDDFTLLDLQEATHLPRREVYVACDGEEPVPAQMYWRQKGNHEGKPSERYRAIVLLHARDAGPAVLANLSSGSVDPWGQPMKLG
ncbi:MAG TPA: gamma-glutamylcyclotransferase family protein [Vicinamibacteria bacterium]|nr:gamma-glutamylcyclotransferase family protein [Vicinamibacteria bacterium]